MTATAALIAAAMLALWLVSLALRDVSIVDVFWGLGFVLVAHYARATTAGCTPRATLVTALVTVWGARLAVYLLWRNWGAGEAIARVGADRKDVFRGEHRHALPSTRRAPHRLRGIVVPPPVCQGAQRR